MVYGGLFADHALAMIAPPHGGLCVVPLGWSRNIAAP